MNRSGGHDCTVVTTHVGQEDHARVASCAAAAPIPPADRLVSLDIVRCVAIAGILFANVMAIGGITLAPRAIRLEPVNGAVSWLEQVFVAGCFYPLFAFLFGVGFVMQLRRAEARASAFPGFWARRMLALLLIGVAHWLLLWNAFILLQLALLGLPLLLFRRRSTKLLLAAAVLCVGLQVYAWPLSRRADGILAASPAVAAYLDQRGQQYRDWDRHETAVLRNGSYAEAVSMRAADLVRTHSTPRQYYPWIYGELFGMLLLGLVAGRHRLFETPERFARLLRWTLVLGVPLGATSRLLRITLRDFLQPYMTLHQWVAVDGLARVGGIALGAAYLAGLLLVLRRVEWRQALAPFAAVGRTALSNYLLQSLLASALFYGYGLGLYGRIGPLGAAGAALTIIALQIPLSVWWTRHYRFGPAEWLWRSLTYAHWQPMRSTRVTRVPPTPEAAVHVAGVEASLP